MHRTRPSSYLSPPVSAPASGRTLIPPTTCPHCGSAEIRATLATEHVQYYLCDACASVWNVAKTRQREISNAPDSPPRDR